MTGPSRHLTDEDYERGMDAFFASLDSSHDWLRVRQAPIAQPAQPTDRTSSTRAGV